MKNLKRLVSIILIASMIFTSNAMITLAENENQVVSSEETTATVGANARGALDSRATASDAEDIAEENIEVDDDFIGPRLVEPEEDEITTANENADTENKETTATAENSDADTIAASTESGASETTVEATETTVEATETTVEATETTVEASESTVGANARGAIVDDIATASDAEEDDNAKTDEEIKIASVSTAEIKTTEEETFGAGSVYYALAGSNPYTLYLKNSAITAADTTLPIIRQGTVSGTSVPWDMERSSINKVEILNNIMPSSITGWFNELSTLSTIEGIDKMDTSEVTDMHRLFFMCQALTSLDLSSFDTSNVTNMAYMFSNCEALTNLNISNFNTENVTDMSFMFSSCKALTSLDVSGFNTERVTDMRLMFRGLQGISTLDISNFNTSNVTNMSQMFSGCKAITSFDFSNFNTSKVTDMSSMFSECTVLANLNLSSFNTSSVTNMSGMFYSCKALTSLDLSNFDTSNVTNMGLMFYLCDHLTSLNTSTFNTSAVTNMKEMFGSCVLLSSIGVNGFDTSNVTNMEGMFAVCRSLTNLDLHNFNTSKVENMKEMFRYCEGLVSLNISSFDTHNVTDMSGVFNNCKALSVIDLSSFDTSNVTIMAAMFLDCYNLKFIKVDASKFNTGNVTNSFNMFYNCNNLIGYEGTVYDDSHRDVTYARLDDADNGNPGYFSEFPRILIYDGTTKIASASYLMSDIGNTVAEPVKPTRAGDTCVGWYKEQALTNTFNFASDTLPGNMRLYVKWGKEYTLPSGWKGTLTTLGRDFDNDIINITFEKHPTAAPTTSVSHATIPSSNGLELYIVANGTKYDAIIYAPEDGVIKALANCGLLFSTGHVNQLQSINNLNYLDTSNATNMSNMFNLCANLTSLDLSGFDTSKVTNMESMFHGAESLTSLDLSGFDTSNVTNMFNMFHNCKRLTSLDVSSFNTSNVTNMFQMFLFCETLTSINVSSFDTSNVTNIGSMFSNCKSLTSLDLSNFDTSNVTNMEGLVARCEELRSIDLSSFDTSNVTNMRGMFTFCRALTTLDLSNFDTTSVTNMEGMFYVCQALTSLDLSNFDTSNVTNMSIMFGDCVKLNLIKVDSSKFNTTNVTNSNNMFNNCSALIGFEETKFDASHIDVSYAHIDAADSGNPGYFSEFPRIFVYDGTTRLARHDYTMANIGQVVTEPTKPTKTGLYFGGWYKEEALTNEFNFATDVLPGNMFLYVKWTTTPPTPTKKTIKSIDINKTPRRTVYTVGDNIDPTGLVIKVTYDDNTTETITYDRKTKNDFTFKPALDTPLTTDDKEVVITYKEKTVTFKIEVEKKSDPTPYNPGGNGGNSGGGSDPTKGPMGDLTKNPEYAKLIDPLVNPLPTQPIDQTLNTTNNLPQEDLIYDTKLIDALKSFPENANPTKANVEDTDGNKGYGEWLNVPRTTTWYFLTGNLKPEDVATMSAKESGGFLRSGWYNLGWKGENKWYHFNTGGVMDIGWYTENNLIYYLEADLQDNWYGKAVTGTKVIDGITYNFGTNGALIP